MKFRIKVQDKTKEPTREPWWEEMEREIGETNSVRGYGSQPMFDGDINKFGRELIDWFNKDASEDGQREFLEAEMIETD